jgi:hypothetical protein
LERDEVLESKTNITFKDRTGILHRTTKLQPALGKQSWLRNPCQSHSINNENKHILALESSHPQNQQRVGRSFGLAAHFFETSTVGVIFHPINRDLVQLPGLLQIGRNNQQPRYAHHHLLLPRSHRLKKWLKVIIQYNQALL